MSAFTDASKRARAAGISERAIAKIWWEEWDRMWMLINQTMSLAHNLMVLVVSPDVETKRAAADEVAQVVTALMWAVTEASR